MKPFRVQGDKMTPPSQKRGDIKRAYPYEFLCNGWIRGDQLVYTCPICNERQHTAVPDGICGGVKVVAITRCCARHVSVMVKGVAL